MNKKQILVFIIIFLLIGIFIGYPIPLQKSGCSAIYWYNLLPNVRATMKNHATVDIANCLCEKYESSPYPELETEIEAICHETPSCYDFVKHTEYLKQLETDSSLIIKGESVVNVNASTICRYKNIVFFKLYPH